MRKVLSSPKFVTITVAVIALLVIPLTLIQVQNQQNLRQRAETILWLTSQSAKTVCDTEGKANISVTFNNTEPNQAAYAMNVTAKDKQTGKSVTMGSIKGGSNKTSTINSGISSLQDGSVTFTLTWTNGRSGTDTRTATYKAITACPKPTATPTPINPSETPVPSGSPTPTICPTLAPVKNVRIDCPNCQ